MANLNLIQSDDPRLYKEAKHLSKKELLSDEIQLLINEMLKKMHSEKAVGLAAPQIGICKSIAVYGYKYRPALPEQNEIPDKVLINPVITPLSNNVEEAYEGCLSIKGIKGLVQRHKDISCTYLDRHGNERTETFHGLEARIIQHECDHLSGILFFKKVSDLATLIST